MNKITTIGLDLAKHVFHVVGCDRHRKQIGRKMLRRGQVRTYFANLPACVVGMEGCASAHYWARELRELGHEVRLVVVGGVKPRINGEQHAPGTTRCSAGRQGVASRQAATRLLRCAPALQVTRRNPLTRLVFMAGSELPAIADQFREHVSPRCQPLHLVFAIYRRFFAAVNSWFLRSMSRRTCEGTRMTTTTHERLRRRRSARTCAV